MIRGILTFSTFASILFFPWLLSVTLATLTAFFEPLVPLAAGLFADAVYYVPGAAHFPYAAIGGGAITLLAFFVRHRLVTGIID